MNTLKLGDGKTIIGSGVWDGGQRGIFFKRDGGYGMMPKT